MLSEYAIDVASLPTTNDAIDDNSKSKVKKNEKED